MQIVAPLPQVPPASPLDVDGLDPVTNPEEPASAANDRGITGNLSRNVANVNLLVARIVAQLCRITLDQRVSLELSLGRSVPVVAICPSDLGFMISAVLGGQLRCLDDSEESLLRIETRADHNTVTISSRGDFIPALGLVRAVATGRGQFGQKDPTMVHCRRLIEERGGTISLTDEGGLIGFALTFPALPCCHPNRAEPAVFGSLGPSETSGVGLRAAA